MKISKKKAIKLASLEWILRNGEWEPIDNDPSWTLEDEVQQDGIENYIKYPERMIATMMYDQLFRHLTKKEINSYKRICGSKLWQTALDAFLQGHHDT